MRRILLVVLILLAGRAAATGEINVLTDLDSPFPAGCIAVSLPVEPVSEDNTLYDEVVPAPGMNRNSLDSEVRVTIWRVGCHEPGHSVVMVRLQKVSGENPVLVPQVFAEAGTVDLPFHRAQLITHPAVGDVGASSNTIPEDGRTWMLAVEPFSVDGETTFTPSDYNELFTLELFWGAYTLDAAQQGELFDINEYIPEFDPPQFEFPLLHGRMSGQWVIDGIPSTGLSLMVGEQEDDTNFVFALFFTYFEGEPFWVTGNTGGQEPGFDFVEFDMYAISGGEFFSLGPDSFDQDDLSQEKLGIMSIEAIDCNTLLIGYDFAEAGLGNDVIEARRMVDVAGYDCNAWE